MSILPDELWRTIMEIGIATKALDHKSLCSLSITCRRFRRLAAEDSVWSPILLTDFPSSGDQFNGENNGILSSSKLKNVYKIRYEKDREQKRLAHRRAVLRIESEIAERFRKIREIEHQYKGENEKMNKAVAELLNLQRARQASVALNVWQPEMIRGRQRQVVQQSNVSADFRINALEMELRLCKQQVAGFDKALKVERRRLHEARERLASVKYHPLQDLRSTNSRKSECHDRSKRLKHT